MNCLSCGEPISDGDRDWHRHCARSFFASPDVPRVELSSETLASAAAVSVKSGQTVAGVQRKLSVHPTGFILKPQTPDYLQLPELEHLTMTLADLVGITTVPHGLIRLEDGSLAYITRRIDRDIPRKPAPSNGRCLSAFRTSHGRQVPGFI